MDWTKPIELLDGTPLKLVSGPDEAGDYTLAREDGLDFDGEPDPACTLYATFDGRRATPETTYTVVRNRAESPEELIAKVEALLRELKAAARPALYRFVGPGDVVLYGSESRADVVAWIDARHPRQTLVPIRKGNFISRVIDAEGDAVGWLEFNR